MRSAAIAISLFLAAGIVIVRYAYTRGDDSEWTPVTMPYPGANYTVEDTFRIYRGGRFELEVATPANQQELRREAPPIAASLHVVLRRSHGLTIDRMIRSLQVGGWQRDRDLFFPDAIWELPSGDYTLQLTGTGEPPILFSTRGAMVRLTRIEPVGPDLLIDASKWIGYLFLFLAFGIAAGLAFAHGKSAAPTALSNSG